MQYRLDPKTGNKLSILGFGCMRFKGNKKDTEDLIIDAINKGVNYFDTAYIYPGSEEMLGKTLAKHGLREKVYIATKMPLVILKSEEQLDKFFNAQLERLKTDYIDYYLLHMLADTKEWEKLCGWNIKEWIEKKKSSGQIKQLGFSYHGSKDEFLKLLDVYDWDFVQIQYNYSDENYQAGVTGLKAAAEKNIPVMIMEPLLGGKLVDGLPTKAEEAFKEAEPNASMVSWAFKWLWNQPEVTLLLSGMNQVAQLNENVELADKAYAGMLGKAEEETFKKVKDIFNESYKVHCTGCHYCMPCPHGVDIPGCFSAYNTYYAIGKGTGFMQYLMSTLMSNDPSYASLCKQCGLCERHCPQHIEIREELKAVEKTMESLKFKATRIGYGLLKKFKNIGRK